MKGIKSLPSLATAADPILNELIEGYAARLEAGEPLNVEECAREHPEYADQLRKLMPTMKVLADLGRAPESNGAALPADDEMSGTLGDYRLLGEIGRGGMGIVYEAEQISLGRRVALKVLPFAATMDKRQLHRFLNEARAAAWLRHPHIVPVYAVGCTRGVNYYAMQFIDGQSLETLLQTMRDDKQPAPPPDTDATAAQPRPSGSPSPLRGEGRVGGAAKSGDTLRAHNSTLKSSKRGQEDWRRVAELAVQAAEAMEHAHQSGVIHRDVKPANLMLDENGDLWVTDFGLAQVQTDARLTMTGDLIGTLRYMSPEQALAKRVIVDHRTDIYSLGATFYEVLTLKPVFAGQDRQELLRQIAFEEPAPPRRLNRAIPAELETIILKALEKNPADRYGTAKEMADDLKRYLNDEPTLARRPTLWQRGRKWSRRHVAAVRATAAAVLLLVATAGAMVGLWIGERTNRERETDRVVNALLLDADQLQDNRKMPEALAKVKQAEAVLNSGTATPALTERVEARLTDLEMVAELEEIRGLRAVTTKIAGFDHAQFVTKYDEVFRKTGIDVVALPPDEAAKRLGERSVAVELAAALDDWADLIKRTPELDKTKKPDAMRWKHLLAVARAIDPDPWRAKLRETLEQGNFESLKLMAASLEVEKLPAATVFVFGRALKEGGAAIEAAQLLRKARRRYPADFWINFQLGAALNAQNPPVRAEAICFYIVATTLRPGSAPAHSNLSVLLIDEGRVDEAIAELKEAVHLKPDYAPAHHNLGYALRAKGRIDEAIAAHQEAVRLVPDHAGVRNDLGMALLGKNRLDKAIDEFKEAARLKPDFALANFNLARALGLKDRPEDPIGPLKEALSFNPDYAPGHFSLGNALRAKGRLDDAMEEWREAGRLDPPFAEPHISLGAAFIEKGQLDDAIAELQVALRIQPNNALAHHNLGLALARKGWLSVAVFEYREAIRLKADSPQAYCGIALLLANSEDARFRDPKQALENANKAVELEPKAAYARNTLGVALYRNGKWKDAIDALNDAIKLRKEAKGSDFFFLAMAHWHLPDKDQAWTWYGKGVEWMEKKRPNDPELRRFRAEAAELLEITAATPKGKEPPGAK